MVNYNDPEIIKYLGQYKMLEDGLSLIFAEDKREKIYEELTDIEQKIIKLTTIPYEEEYTLLLGKTSYLLEDERSRLTLLINIIEERTKYLEQLIKNHRLLTGIVIKLEPIMGSKRLSEFKERITIIDKYNSNIKQQEKLIIEINSLDSRLNLASEKININDNLNKELEKKLVESINNILKKYNLFELQKQEDEITKTYDELLYSLDLATRNVELAKTASSDILIDCQNILIGATKDYKEYEEKKYILELIKIYNKPINEYQELMDKREQINDIVSKLTGCTFYPEMIKEITKQYNTIKIEIQDIKTYNSLKEEKEKQVKNLEKIEKENNSKKFKNILNELLENEKKRKEQELQVRKKRELEEKQKKLLLEQERQVERLKQQRIIEDKRKKDQEQRAKQLLSDQKKSIFNTIVQAESFNNIKEEQTEKTQPIDNIPTLEEIKNNIEKTIKENDKKEKLESFFATDNDLDSEIFPDLK